MSRQERTTVSSLNGRNRGFGSGVNTVLKAIDEEAPLSERLARITILPPLHMGVEAGPPSPAPSSAPLPSLRHRHESICRSNTTTTRRDLNDRQLEERKLLRRNSTAIYSKPLPPSPLLQPPSPPPQSQTAQSDLDRKSAAEFRNQLRAWSHIYYGNATTADAFVIARSLQQRRHSISTAAPAAAVSSPTSLEHQRQCQNKHQHRRFWHHGSAFSSKGGGRGGGDSASPGNSQPQPLPLPTRLTVRTIIRPRDPERQPFLLQRNFDLNALRATVPDSVGGSHVPSPRPQTQIQDCVSYPSPRSSASVSSSSFSPAGVGGDGRRRSSPVGPEGLRAPQRPPLARRRTSLKSSELLSGRGVGTEATSDVAVDYESLVLDPRAVPVHRKYARAYLPVLAALLVSGHVREGDVIYLPLPFAEAWPQTVWYVYTGLGELTPPVRENIIYLAGKV